MGTVVRTTSTILALMFLSCGAAWAQSPKWLQAAPAGDWRAMSMRDTAVRDSNGEEVGKLVDFLVGHNGSIEAAIIDIGALTHEANSQIAVPFDQLHISVAGTASAEDLARGGSAPKTPSEPLLSGPQGSSAAGAAKAMENVPGTITIPVPKDEIRNAPRFQARP